MATAVVTVLDSFQRKKIVAVEFYSGIGGMHYAMERVLGDKVVVRGAFDINTTVNAIYKHNFPHVSPACPKFWGIRL